MGLKLETIWQRLKILLAYHDKLREENREKAKMDQAARKIKRLVWLLERYDEKNVSRCGFND